MTEKYKDTETETDKDRQTSQDLDRQNRYRKTDKDRHADTNRQNNRQTTHDLYINRMNVRVSVSELDRQIGRYRPRTKHTKDKTDKDTQTDKYRQTQTIG